MDLWQIILADHANIEELCREILHATGSRPSSRAHLFDELDAEMHRHIRAKSSILYPALAQDSRTRSYLSELNQRQEDILDHIDELAAQRDKNSRAWVLDFKDLVSTISHYFSLEENGVLTVARSTIGPDEAESLRRAYEREKIALLQARRWHLPAAVMPSRYGLPTGVAIGALAGIVAVGAAAVAWQMSKQGGGLSTGSARGPLRSPLSKGGSMHARRAVGAHPHVRGNINNALIRCIEECYSCAQACTSCADACLGEPMVDQLTQCIRLNLDCADVCSATGSVATRRTGSNEEVIRRMLAACANACRLCAQECERHAAMHEHCSICAQACRSCEQACQEALRSMA